LLLRSSHRWWILCFFVLLLVYLSTALNYIDWFLFIFKRDKNCVFGNFYKKLLRSFCKLLIRCDKMSKLHGWYCPLSWSWFGKRISLWKRSSKLGYEIDLFTSSHQDFDFNFLLNLTVFSYLSNYSVWIGCEQGY
jgi:hypothetical protein